MNKIINKKCVQNNSSNSNPSSSSSSSSVNDKYLYLNFFDTLKNKLSTSISDGFNQNIINNNNSGTNTGDAEVAGSFLSILLSTVLKYHLSWVYTVLPSNELLLNDDNCSNEIKNIRSKLRKKRANWTSILEKTNPYNPLWAQLGDLHGAVNYPLKLVRTVIVGQNRELVERLLFLLSYFIRCGNSSYFDIVQENFDFDKLAANNNVNNVNTSLQQRSFVSPLSTSVSSTSASSSDSSSNQLDKSYDDLLPIGPIDQPINVIKSPKSRAINIVDLKYDVMQQFSNLIDTRSANRKYAQNDMNNKDEINNNNNFNDNKSITSPTTITSSSVASPSTITSPINHTKNSTELFDTDTVNKQSKSKQRRLSSNSNGENCSAQELPLIGCQLKPNYVKSTRMQDNFGYSLLASYCEKFVFEFVLHGTSDRSFLNNLQQRLSFSKQVRIQPTFS